MDVKWKFVRGRMNRNASIRGMCTTCMIDKRFSSQPLIPSGILDLIFSNPAQEMFKRLSEPSKCRQPRTIEETICLIWDSLEDATLAEYISPSVSHNRSNLLGRIATIGLPKASSIPRTPSWCKRWLSRGFLVTYNFGPTLFSCPSHCRLHGPIHRTAFSTKRKCIWVLSG